MYTILSNNYKFFIGTAKVPVDEATVSVNLPGPGPGPTNNMIISVQVHPETYIINGKSLCPFILNFLRLFLIIQLRQECSTFCHQNLDCLGHDESGRTSTS